MSKLTLLLGATLLAAAVSPATEFSLRFDLAPFETVSKKIEVQLDKE